ncbi:Gfo/Idh/MocA family protein [Dyella tabacisoli]|nr:Gfo/Idh/MocA family oxidoreductase [Dyella tabacisoli]
MKLATENAAIVGPSYSPLPRMGTAVVGVGYFGSLHAQCYSRLPGCKLIAVVDPDPAAQSVAQRLGVSWLRDIDELPHSVQTVSVATPVGTHYALTKSLLKRGFDVLLEKPIAETPEQAKELCMLAATNRRILQIGHIERFNPAFSLGPSLLSRAQAIDMARTTQRPPRGDQLNVVMDLMIHDLDLILYGVASVITGFHAEGHSRGITAIDDACVELRFGNGCVVRLNSHWGGAASGNDRCMLVRLEGGETWALDFLRRTAYRTTPTQPHDQDLPTQISSPPHDSLSLQLASFIHASRHRTAPQVTPEHGHAALDLAQKIQAQILGGVS